jgi:hypothetical protein
MIMLTTTAVELDEELVNRALVLTVDETQAQTRAIHRLQRAKRTLDGLLAREARREVLERHQHAQRLLEPVPVVNPYAPQLTFVDARTRTRRDHEKYLTLIDVIALLHQHQRERKTIERHGRTLTYIEVTAEDIATANRLAAVVFGRSLDELPPQTRYFLEHLDAWVSQRCRDHRMHRSDVRFLAREAREALGTGATQTKVHLRRLVELEYVLVHRAPRGQGVAYELAYSAAEDAAADVARFSGLRDASALGAGSDKYDPEPSASSEPRSAAPGERSALGRPAVGAPSGEGWPSNTSAITHADAELHVAAAHTATTAVNGSRPPRGRTVRAGARG